MNTAQIKSIAQQLRNRLNCFPKPGDVELLKQLAVLVKDVTEPETFGPGDRVRLQHAESDSGSDLTITEARLESGRVIYATDSSAWHTAAEFVLVARMVSK